MPNTLVVSTFGCPFSEFEMMVKKVDKEQGYVFCSELEIVKVNEHKAMILMNCSDLEKFGAMLEQPELKYYLKLRGLIFIVMENLAKFWGEKWLTSHFY